MGFPSWTLWGMGLSAAFALLALALALLGQSPDFLRRLGLADSGLDRRVRGFSGYAFALMLLAIGFFFAGVPLGPQSDSEIAAGQEQPATTSATPEMVPTTQGTVTVTLAATPATGAFVGLTPTAPPTEAPATDSVEATEQPSATAIPPTPTAADTETPIGTSTPTSTPTKTPTPALTPTPIDGETAIVDTDGSTVWLRRSPGGQNTVLVRDNDLLILMTGHASQGGFLWREVRTLDGMEGWIREEFLDFS